MTEVTRLFLLLLGSEGLRSSSLSCPLSLPLILPLPAFLCPLHFLLVSSTNMFFFLCYSLWTLAWICFFFFFPCFFSTFSFFTFFCPSLIHDLSHTSSSSSDLKTFLEFSLENHRGGKYIVLLNIHKQSHTGHASWTYRTYSLFRHHQNYTNSRREGNSQLHQLYHPLLLDSITQASNFPLTAPFRKKCLQDQNDESLNSLQAHKWALESNRMSFGASWLFLKSKTSSQTKVESRGK